MEQEAVFLADDIRYKVFCCLGSFFWTLAGDFGQSFGLKRLESDFLVGQRCRRDAEATFFVDSRQEVFFLAIEMRGVRFG